MSFISRKKIVVVFVITLILAGSSLFLNSKDSSNQSIRTVNIQGLYKAYSDTDSLDASADIILVGSPIKEFTERESVTTKYSDGELQAFYTLSEFKIEKVIKNESELDLENEKIMKVIEPIALVDFPGETVKMTLGNYVEMHPNNTYLIFIKQSLPGHYGIINMNNGKFNLDDAEKVKKDFNGSGSELNQKLKEEFIEMYELNK